MVYGEGLFSGTALLIVSGLIALIWILIEVKRIRHKIFAIFLVFAIIFLYWGAIVVFQGQNIDFTSFSGAAEASKVYFSWLLSVFSNIKSVTASVIQLDWSSYNKSIT